MKSLRSLFVVALASLVALPALAAPKKAAPKGKTEITWFGHAAFRIVSPGGTVLFVDPWLSNPSDTVKDALQKVDKADYILVTHGHFDHVGDTVALQKKTGAKIVATFELGADLVQAGVPQDAASMATLGNSGGTMKLSDDVEVTFVPAVHGSGFQLDQKSPPAYGGIAVGYVIRIKNGPTIYHTGDTDVFEGMKLIGERFHPDVMLACIGGHFTMDPTGAAMAAKLVNAKTIVPMHFGTFPVLTGSPADLQKALKTEHAKAKMQVLAVGQPTAF